MRRLNGHIRVRRRFFEAGSWLAVLLLTLGLSAWVIFTRSGQQISVTAQPQSRADDMKRPNGHIRVRGRFFEAGSWLTVLLLTLGLSAWAIFTRSGQQQISVTAQPQSREYVTWRGVIPGFNLKLPTESKAGVSSVRVVRSTIYSTARITSKRLDSHAWKGAQLDLYVFATSALGNAGKSLEHGRLSSDDDMQMTVYYNFIEDRMWRSLRYDEPASLWLISFLEYPSTKVSEQKPYGYVTVAGKSQSKFELQEGFQNCGSECVGQFADFKAQLVYPDPLEFRGQGTEGMNKITVASTSESKYFRRDTQGALCIWTGARYFFLREITDRVSLTAKEGQFNFNGQTLALGPEVLLEISFDESAPGQIEISHSDPPLVSIVGSANEVRLGGENLMPRVMDKTPWYLQVLIGIVLTFCVERLYAIFGRAKLSANMTKSGAALTRTES